MTEGFFMSAEKLFTLSDGIKSAQGGVVVYGTGRMALLTHTALLQEGVGVTAFCSPDGANTDLRVMGKPVITLEALRRMSPAPEVVVAGEDLESSVRELEDAGVSRLWVDSRSYDIISDCVWSFM